MQSDLLQHIACCGLIPGDSVAVACSGGADSMALTLLVAAWVRERGGSCVALTVDHGLRPESAVEAEQVGGWLIRRGIAHVILPWQGKKPTRNIQAAAREARYRLMAEYAAAHGINTLLVAHHLEDQAETFLLRLARGSGVDGLSSMQPETLVHGTKVLRPLLQVPKASLEAYLLAQGQEYCRDPSNENSRYDRVKFRKLLPVLAEVGLTPQRLAATAHHMTRARMALEEETRYVLASSCRFFGEGYAVLQPFSAPQEITLRVLASLVMRLGGHKVKPRLEETEHLQTMLARTDFKGLTLGGCEFIAHKGAVIICREAQAVAPPVPVGSGMWDHRFLLAGEHREGWTVGALTQQGWLDCARKNALQCPFPSKKIAYTLPCLRDEAGLIQAVPHLRIGEGLVCQPVPFTWVTVPSTAALFAGSDDAYP